MQLVASPQFQDDHSGMQTSKLSIRPGSGKKQSFRKLYSMCDCASAVYVITCHYQHLALVWRIILHYPAG